jgi:hypothetical protein
MCILFSDSEVMMLSLVSIVDICACIAVVDVPIGRRCCFDILQDKQNANDDDDGA